MLYAAPIETITWQSVEDFLAQQIKEGAYLDYKVAWPDRLENTIAAMANTLGGVIVVGVAENNDGSPVQPPVGVPLERGLAEKVTNIVLSSITPPVFPEVSVCPNSAQDKAIVVIRVPQSHQTPHATKGNRRVYLRTGNRNNPEELATVDEIEWLREHRARALALRNSLYQTAVDRSDYFMGYTTRPEAGERRRVPGTKPYLLLCVVPYYPRAGTLISPPQLRPLSREIRLRDYYGTGPEFPLADSQPRLLQDGVYLLGTRKNDSGERHYYTEFSAHGQLFYRQSVGFKHGNALVIRAPELFARLDQFMHVAKSYVVRLNYQGNVWFHCLVGGLASTKMMQWNVSEQWIETTEECHDEAVAFETSWPVSNWDADSEAAMMETVQKIGWAYDWEISPALVRAYFAKHRRS